MAVTIFLSATNIPQIAAQLQKNADYATVLYLNLTNPQRNVEVLPAHDMDELREAIRVNTTITKLVITTSWVEVHDEEVNRFFPSVIQELSKLRNLQALDVQLIKQTNFDRIGAALTYFLSHCNQLETLLLSRVEMGDLATPLFRDWGSILAKRSSLKQFKMERCGFSESQRTLPILDPLLESLATMQDLEKVSLIGSENSSGVFTRRALLNLCQSTSLTDLQCYGWGLPQILSSVASLLREGTSRLRKIEFDFVKERDDYFILADLLAAETSVESLDFHETPQLDDEEELLMTVAGALRRNRTLTLFCMSDRRMRSAKVMQAFLDMLEVNYTLRFLGFAYNSFDSDENLSAKLDFYLKLNRYGRGELLENDASSREDWLEKLVEIREDLSCIFYFIGKHPMLCESRHVGS